ncbi:MAG: hypothetical protein IT290_09405 [Deltaproteobacteria bacterium]|nr:hypothetical protein [Deltaproteobacteria bacterium]
MVSQIAQPISPNSHPIAPTPDLSPLATASLISLPNALGNDAARKSATETNSLSMKEGETRGALLSIVLEAQGRWEQEYRTMRSALERARGPVRALLEAQDSAQRIQRTSELIGRSVDSFGEAIRKVSQSAASG